MYLCSVLDPTRYRILAESGSTYYDGLKSLSLRQAKLSLMTVPMRSNVNTLAGISGYELNSWRGWLVACPSRVLALQVPRRRKQVPVPVPCRDLCTCTHMHSADLDFGGPCVDVDMIQSISLWL